MGEETKIKTLNKYYFNVMTCSGLIIDQIELRGHHITEVEAAAETIIGYRYRHSGLSTKLVGIEHIPNGVAV